MLAAVLGVAACGVVHGQTLEFFARERAGAIARDDKAAAVAFYEDTSSNPSTKWMFTAGYVTHNDGNGNPHTRLAVFKYPADTDNVSTQTDPPGPSYGASEESAFYPPGSGGSWTPVGQHAATAMALDASGNVYVCGYTTLEENGDNGSDANYIIIKYTKDLVVNSTWASNTSWGMNGAHGFDGTASSPDGDDKAVSIAVSLTDGTVMVTGTSAGPGDNDIATLRLTASGVRSSAWADDGEGPGVRRYDGGEGEDTAAQIGYFYTVDQEVSGLQTIVVGTSDQGASNLDTAVLCYDEAGNSEQPTGGWKSFFDAAGGDDHGTGLAVAEISGATQVVACGYAEMDNANPPDIDYAVYKLDGNNGSTSSPNWVSYHDFSGEQDVAVDICWGTAGSLHFVWVTGSAEYSGHPRTGTAAFDWADGAVLDSTTYTYNGGDTVANAICDSGGGCMVTGMTPRAVGDPELFIVRYLLNPPDPPTTPNAELAFVWAVLFPGNGNYQPDEGLAIVHGLDADEPIVGGATTYSSGALTDLTTLRIEP